MYKLKKDKMKKIFYIAVCGIAFTMGLASCQKYLDINDNPNSATSSTPELMLSQALTATANVVNNYNTMGAQLVGYQANAGGYGGFGSAVTYSFGTGNYQGCWSSAYDNLTDYQWIITHTEGDADHSYYNAVAKIMKAFDFQLLVDTYNNVPYSKAFLEKANLTPAYDDAKAVYDSIYALLDNALATINNAPSSVLKFTSNDVMFNGNMDSWKQLANTIKLRIAIRGKAGGLTFNNSYDAVGFLTKDAIVNPGYQQANGKQNPEYNTWGYTYSSAVGNRAWMTNKFVSAFYDGNKLDDYRGYAILNNFGTSSYGTNQLGYESNSVKSAPSAGSWITQYETKENNIGILKGPSAGMPIFTLAESDFLQAEAALVGGLGVTGSAETYFNNGVLDSYKYLYMLRDGTYDLANWDPNADYQAYLSMNPSSYLVHYNLATTDAQRLEAIITQQYIALNMITSDQAWNDFRRTGYPKIVNGSTNGVLTFASLQSLSTRADKLPTRILYPTSEFSYNNDNVPKDIDQFTSRIFWDPE